MPSTIVGNFSGGVLLVSGNILSGTPFDLGNDYYGAHGFMGGIQLKLSKNAPGPVYVGLPNPYYESGISTTLNSGGSLASGGLRDGMELFPGEDFFVGRSRLGSGYQSIRIVMEAAHSGGRLFWEPM